MNEIYEYDQNAIGKIEIAPEVIQIISGIAAASVEGVIGLSGEPPRISISCWAAKI